MDKETLSNYGWIVICVLVLAVMLAFATPFGQFVADAVKSTTQGLFDTNQKALDSANIHIMEQEFEDMLNTQNSTIQFEKSYVGKGEPGSVAEMIFYENGSCTFIMYDTWERYIVSNESYIETFPEGTFTYQGNTAIDNQYGDVYSFSEDGKILYWTYFVEVVNDGVVTDSYTKTTELYLQGTAPILLNELYTVNNGEISVVFRGNGTVDFYQNYVFAFSSYYKELGSKVLAYLIEFDIADNSNSLATEMNGTIQTFYCEPGKLAELS